MAYRAIRMEDLHAGKKHRQPGNLVLDVRSAAEYRRGHVPGSWNIPVREVERHPGHLRRPLASFDTVYVHCSSGPRAKRAYDALERTGLSNLVHVRESGMPQWVRRRYAARVRSALRSDP